MKIAVVGAGISGLSCAWLLAKHSSGPTAPQITLFEKNDYLGGHTNTIDVNVEGKDFPVDTGFLVFNEWTYPNFIPMMQHLGVETAASDMSFGIKLTEASGRSRLEWCGSDDISTVFAQPSNLFKPAFLGMLADLFRFNRAATHMAEHKATLSGTLGEYLDQHQYGRAFRDWYLVPMAACIWSTPTKQIDHFPLATFITFCANHGLISVNNRPKWRTIKGGARNYVEKIRSHLSDIRLNAKIHAVKRSPDGVMITTAQGEEAFDHVVMACHTDESLALLADVTTEERCVLEAIRYLPNTAVLHTDRRQLPDRTRAWASWNYHAEYHSQASRNDSPVSLTYLLNKLQPLPVTSPVMVTMNPLQSIDPAKVIKTISYDHPLFLPESVGAKRDLRKLQGTNNTWFAGAWTRYGFHEDGLMSGIAVARALGATTPWATNTPAANDLASTYPGVDDAVTFVESRAA
ncbi:MAG: FAD-dependent oxidoreductase [Aeromicrobium sp.]|nr:FAD-dependent oxidoreductase [Burkholderiales bacterium]